MNKSTQLITGPDIMDLTATAKIEATDRKEELLFNASMISHVVTGQEAAEAAETIKAITVFLRRIETSRTTAKGPALEITRAIDALAKDLVSDLKGEAGRIGRLIGDYQSEQDRIRRQAEAAARHAEWEIRNAAEQAAEKARESGRAVEKKLERIDAQTFEKVAESRSMTLAHVVPKIAGLATRAVHQIEVHDAAALFAARPDLCSIVPNESLIKATFKANADLALPGVRHWVEHNTVVR